MRGPCACPGWGGLALASDARPTGSHPHQDKHKAPTLPHVRPLSLQNAGTPLTRFGRQNSSEHQSFFAIVILSAAKDLSSGHAQILRCAQYDKADSAIAA